MVQDTILSTLYLTDTQGLSRICRRGGPPGGVCVTKTERVCGLVLPGVHTCSSFEEGILHAWRGELGAHPVGQG